MKVQICVDPSLYSFIEERQLTQLKIIEGLATLSSDILNQSLVSLPNGTSAVDVNLLVEHVRLICSDLNNRVAARLYNKLRKKSAKFEDPKINMMCVYDGNELEKDQNIVISVVTYVRHDQENPVEDIGLIHKNLTTVH